MIKRVVGHVNCAHWVVSMKLHSVVASGGEGIVLDCDSRDRVKLEASPRRVFECVMRDHPVCV